MMKTGGGIDAIDAIGSMGSIGAMGWSFNCN